MPHSSLPKIVDVTGKKRHMSPIEAYAVHINQGFVPPTMSSFEIDDCFRPRIKVTTRRGEVRVFGNIYFNGELVHHGGEKVFVEYAVQDGSRVWVRDPQERLICIAGFEANRARMFPKSATEEAADKREKRRLEVAERKIDEIREERRGLVDVAPPTKQIEADRAELIASMEANETGQGFTPPGSYLDRIRTYRDMQRSIDGGGELLPKEALWFASFKNHKEYAELMKLEKDLEGKHE
jgi:putative transposase